MKKEMLTEEDIKKIENIISDRKISHSYLLNNNSEVYRKFVTMEEATYSEGSLNKKVKELIAIGISIVINCESCLEWHIHQALKTEATKEEILEAIGVGIEMSGGPGTVAARFAIKVLEYYLEKNK